jgi:hypothetical protein
MDMARGLWPLAVVAGTATVLGLIVSFLTGLHPVITVILVIVMTLVAAALISWRGDSDDRPGRVGFARAAGSFAVAAIAVLVLIQAVPYGRAHANPPITGEPQWATERTRELMVDACFGCHSNEVDWPWYSSIAPVSWAVSRHVDEGRDAVNYSEFDRGQEEADETIEVILEGEMPPGYFTRFGLHPEAKLSRAERAELVEGLRSTPGLSEREGREREDDDD